MKFKHLALTLSFTLGLTSFTYAAQLEPATSVNKEISIIKNVAALKARELQVPSANKSALDQIIKTQKSDMKQSADERRVMNSLTGKTPTFGRSNKFDLFFQSLFGG